MSIYFCLAYKSNGLFISLTTSLSFDRLSFLLCLLQFCPPVNQFVLILPHPIFLSPTGRGTSTYDGTAVASAVLQDLITAKKCRCLFSTHYHLLVDDFKAAKGVRLGHMACMVRDRRERERVDLLPFAYLIDIYLFIYSW